MTRCAYNRQFRARPVNGWEEADLAGAGSGKGEATGAGALAFGRFGFFGSGIALPAAFGGGPAG